MADVDAAARRHRPVITDDPSLLTDAAGIEVIVEATGEVEFGARVATRTIDAGKHLVLINAELDSCLGPILKARADAAGVVITDMAGDQPAVIMDLVDEVRLLGFRPILAGNIKSLLDHKRTPETQRGFAETHGQRPKMITSFADGTKIAAEMGVVANATGFGVAERGMRGPRAERVEQAPERFDLEALLERPIVDYLLGAEPSFGVFVLGYEEDPLTRAYMKFYKMGDGPVYTFYRPLHLGPLETVQSVARAVLLHDAAAAPLGGPVTEVVTQAKRDLAVGETLDGIGGFTVYGMLESIAGTARGEPAADGADGWRRSSVAWPRTRRSPSTTSSYRPIASRRRCGASRRITSASRPEASMDSCRSAMLAVEYRDRPGETEDDPPETMEPLTIAAGERLDILVIGAHADDIELGAGGTILRMLAEHPGSRITWVIATASSIRAAEARASAAAFSADAEAHEVILADLHDGRLPAHLPALKDLLEPLNAHAPDLVIGPSTEDAHQDHRALAEVVWQTFRHHLVWEYEIPKYDGDLGCPNLFVAIDEATITRKIDLLEAFYPSQRTRSWWGGETVRAIARLRGIEAAGTLAEAFHARKIVI